MNKLLLIVVFGLSCLRGWAAVSVPLTIQEALYPGSMSGLARTNEPFCQGVPIADSAAITNTQSLIMSGISVAQFRILSRWPDGNAKWIKACGILPTLAAGGTATTTLSSSGSGNTSCGSTSLPNGTDTSCSGYGGSNLAVDNGSTITVNTGVATFSIKKATSM